MHLTDSKWKVVISLNEVHEFCLPNRTRHSLNTILNLQYQWLPETPLGFSLVGHFRREDERVPDRALCHFPLSRAALLWLVSLGFGLMFCVATSKSAESCFVGWERRNNICPLFCVTVRRGNYAMCPMRSKKTIWLAIVYSYISLL